MRVRAGSATIRAPGMERADGPTETAADEGGVPAGDRLGGSVLSAARGKKAQGGTKRVSNKVEVGPDLYYNGVKLEQLDWVRDGILSPAYRSVARVEGDRE